MESPVPNNPREKHAADSIPDFVGPDCSTKLPKNAADIPRKKIAKENPALFEDLQERFIHDSHYKPALQAVSQRTGLSGEHMSPALQEVLWSTAVQHGPNGAARIFSRAMAGLA